MSNKVEFKNVGKSFNGQPAVSNVNFLINDGQLVTLLGPSGCGKTTTLRMVAGLELPSEGSIFIGDDDVTRVSAAQRSVGMAPRKSVRPRGCLRLRREARDASK